MCRRALTAVGGQRANRTNGTTVRGCDSPEWAGSVGDAGPGQEVQGPGEHQFGSRLVILLGQVSVTEQMAPHRILEVFKGSPRTGYIAAEADHTRFGTERVVAAVVQLRRDRVGPGGGLA